MAVATLGEFAILGNLASVGVNGMAEESKIFGNARECGLRGASIVEKESTRACGHMLEMF